MPSYPVWRQRARGGHFLILDEPIPETSPVPHAQNISPSTNKMMTRNRLKPRQRAFVDGVYRGLSLAAAARQAGYAAGSARQTGSRLMQHPYIIEALERRRAGYTGEPPVTADPREFLIWCMNDPELLGMRERIAVASFLMAWR
jgi:hypothetical protein